MPAPWCSAGCSSTRTDTRRWPAAPPLACSRSSTSAVWGSAWPSGRSSRWSWRSCWAAASSGFAGHYFAVGTLGLGVAAGEIVSGIDWLGAGSGLVPPLFPEALGSHNRFFSFYFLVVAVICFVVLQILYRRRFGLLLNAIRDDEDKAEAMGLPTTRCKVVAWSVAAFFLALTGGAYGNFIGFIDPLDTAFSGATLGVWMILMAIMGGRGSLWGPVLGAMVFHVTQELFWTFLLGWHRVAMGLLIVVIVMFLPDGILGWFRERRGNVALDAGRGA